MRRRLWITAFSFGLLAATGVAQAQSRPSETAEQNVRESQQYENLLCSNPSFRARRIAQECGPVTDPQMHASCLASFECNQPPRRPHWRRAPPSETAR
ncbi:MAG TPA: hypothetical protein VHY35_00195 [Stellaceae bacterium]|jgi:hypothetical protein|nr:hypothetical protein [Stellaceae bacterium]